MDGDLSKDEEKAAVFNAFLVTKILREQLYQPNICKSMGPVGIHPRVLKELE